MDTWNQVWYSILTSWELEGWVYWAVRSLPALAWGMMWYCIYKLAGHFYMVHLRNTLARTLTLPPEIQEEMEWLLEVRAREHPLEEPALNRLAVMALYRYKYADAMMAARRFR